MSEQQKKQQQPDSAGGKRPRPNAYWIYIALFAVGLGLFVFSDRNDLKETTPRQFRTEMLADGEVAKVKIVNKEFAEIYLTEEALALPEHEEVSKPSFGRKPEVGPHYYLRFGDLQLFEQQLAETQEQLPADQHFEVGFETRHDVLGEILSWVLPIGLILLVWIFILRRMSPGGVGPGGGNVFNFGKSSARVFDTNNKSKVTFDNVAGHEEAKAEVREIVDFLKNPEKYTRLGAKIPKGVILAGPPGTGKTLLAKAVAGEAEVPFFSLSGSEFVEMFVGVGASRVRDLFRKAKEKSPSIIFIDEIDAIGRSRGKQAAFSGNDERENTLNQLLAEMDGFGSNTGVIVMAATNRANILDRALTRPGRFDRHIYLDLPNLKERSAIFSVHLKPLKVSPSLKEEHLARQTPGFSGADIANVCNEAALVAARRDKEVIELDDFNDAIDRVVAGLERKSRIISPAEKRTIAWHEAGHAVTSWLLKHANPLVKVTIVPRGRALGAAWYMPEERQLTNTSQFLDEMCTMLGGRAAEDLVFGDTSSGALDDLERVTKQAYSMVAYYGLNDKLGHISYYDSSGQDQGFTKPYSDETAKLIDDEVRKLVSKAFERTRNLLSRNREKLDAVAELLLKKEMIVKEEVEEIMGFPAASEKPAIEAEGIIEDIVPLEEAGNDLEAADDTPEPEK